ncbi:MAG TPA: hypothetical protein V6C64_05910 [Microcoleaceae cyanobacterium]|jgi:hypothetical protein
MSQKHIRNLLLLTTVTASLLFSSSARADQRDFTLINDSSTEIYELNVSTVQTSDWEEDILGRDTLPSGEQIQINFNTGASGTCYYDVRVITANQQEATASNVNLCQVSTVIFDGSQLLSR